MEREVFALERKYSSYNGGKVPGNQSDITQLYAAFRDRKRHQHQESFLPSYNKLLSISHEVVKFHLTEVC